MAFSEEMRLKGLEVRRARKAAREAARLARQQASMQEPALQPPAVPPKPDPTGEIEFEGMTATECCDACNVKMCVISGINICGHPFKGSVGLQREPATAARYKRAKHMLAGQKLNLQNAGG